ncbi:MAG: tRNA lysidine(34) synthetase TilS [Bacteroidota bacterium]
MHATTEPNILVQFRAFVQQQQINVTDRTLLAISGGVDSMVMGELFYRASFPFAVAHCNFQLRGAASDADEQLVQRRAAVWGVPFHSKRFETEQAVQQPQQSLQMIARQLRFDWFHELLRQFSYQQIATAHHANDAVETAWYNFAKGCGLRGLRGILPRQDRLIHPLLFATKSDIRAFAKAKQIPFREDASNETDKYARNFIRHHISPQFQQLNPNFEQTAIDNMRRLREAEILYEKGLQVAAFEISTTHFERPDSTGQCKEWRRTFDTTALAAHPAAETILYEQLKREQFSPPQITQILQAAQRPQGQYFESATHRILVLQQKIILEARPSASTSVVLSITTREGQLRHEQHQWQWAVLNKRPSNLRTPPNEVLLDLDLLQFPLRLRRYQSGDQFRPFGMKGATQTIKKYCQDRHIDRFQRERLWLLYSANTPCWVVGQRADERFKITSRTKRILHLSYQLVDAR